MIVLKEATIWPIVIITLKQCLYKSGNQEAAAFLVFVRVFYQGSIWREIKKREWSADQLAVSESKWVSAAGVGPLALTHCREAGQRRWLLKSDQSLLQHQSVSTPEQLHRIRERCELTFPHRNNSAVDGVIPIFDSV